MQATRLALRTDDAPLLQAAREAYTGAFHVMGFTGVVVMAVVLLLTARRAT